MGGLHGRRETIITSRSLIAAEKVKRTDVYNADGEELGTVDDILIDKISGKAIYAIMSFGGFLGIGEKYHPLPLSTLTYDESKGGYVVNLDRKMLEDARPTIWTMSSNANGRPAMGGASINTTMCRATGRPFKRMFTGVPSVGDEGWRCFAAPA
jgi:hypothetical protein